MLPTPIAHPSTCLGHHHEVSMPIPAFGWSPSNHDRGFTVTEGSTKHQPACTQLRLLPASQQSRESIVGSSVPSARHLLDRVGSDSVEPKTLRSCHVTSYTRNPTRKTRCIVWVVVDNNDNGWWLNVINKQVLENTQITRIHVPSMDPWWLTSPDPRRPQARWPTASRANIPATPGWRTSPHLGVIRIQPLLEK